MSKLTTGITGGAALAFALTGFVQLQANRDLRRELGAQRAAGDGLVALRRESAKLNSALQTLAARNPEADELTRLQQRAALLAARPAGVVDGELKRASGWADVGRATPEAATETLHRAMFGGELDAVAKFMIFDDDTPENRAAFMAHFSEAVRARYQTPERLQAAAVFGAGQKNSYSPNDAFQILGVDDHVGGNGSRFGQKRVRVWYSLASGREFEGATRWQQTPEGWSVAAFSLAKEWQYALPILDPATGDRILPPAKK